MSSKKNFLSNCKSAIQVSYVPVRQWLEILINGFLIKKVLAVGGWSWMVVDIFWLVVGGGGYISVGGWWWVVMDGGGWWHSLVWPNNKHFFKKTHFFRLTFTLLNLFQVWASRCLTCCVIIYTFWHKGKCIYT